MVIGAKIVLKVEVRIVGLIDLGNHKGMLEKLKRIVMILFLFIITETTISAEYNGNNIDGTDFDCSAYSYDTGRYYEVSVEFSGDEVIITFQNGNQITLSLNDEVIDDPSSIEAYDYGRSVYWELNVYGID